MSKQFMLAAGFALAALVVPLPAAAAATPACSAARPAELHFTDGPADRTINLESGRKSAKQYQFSLDITGCKLAAGDHKVRLIGLAKGTGVTALLDVRRSGSSATLVVDPSQNSLGPDNYPMTVVSDDPAINLSHPLTINVTDSRLLPWLGVTGAAVLIGFMFLALRAAAASQGNQWKNVTDFFTPEAVLPAVVGIAGVGTAVLSRVLSNDAWYGTTPDLIRLGIAALTAMIAGGTVATAATGVGAKTKEAQTKDPVTKQVQVAH